MLLRGGEERALSDRHGDDAGISASQRSKSAEGGDSPGGGAAAAAGGAAAASMAAVGGAGREVAVASGAEPTGGSDL